MHELGITLLRNGKVVKQALSPPVAAWVSVSNKVGCFYISTEELWIVSLFPCRNHSTRSPNLSENFLWFKWNQWKSSIFGECRSLFGLNKQMLFVFLILLDTGCILPNNPFWKDKTHDTSRDAAAVLDGCGFASENSPRRWSGLGLEMFHRTNPCEFLLVWLAVIIWCPKSFPCSGLQTPL